MFSLIDLVLGFVLGVSAGVGLEAWRSNRDAAAKRQQLKNKVRPEKAMSAAEWDVFLYGDDKEWELQDIKKAVEQWAKDQHPQ